MELAGQDGDAKLLGELLVEWDTMTVAELQKRQKRALAYKLRHCFFLLVWLKCQYIVLGDHTIMPLNFQKIGARSFRIPIP